MDTCRNCGATPPNDARYCPSCGTYLAPSDKNETTEAARELTRLRAFQKRLLDDVRSFSGHLDTLERAIASGAASEPEQPETIEPAVESEQSAPKFTEAEPAAKPPARPLSKPLIPASMEENLGQRILLIIGVIVIIFGAGYFVKYSFERGWVGPAGRVMLAYLWGLSFLGGGELFRRKGFGQFGLPIIGGGIAILYFATFAAFQLYGLVDIIPAFILMILTTALAVALAVVYDTMWLAALGLLGGFLTPFLLATGESNTMALLSYVLVLNAGVLGTAFYKQWRLLNVIGMAGTYVVYAVWFFMESSESDMWAALVFVNIYFLIYAALPFIYEAVHEFNDVSRTVYGAFINSLLAFLFSSILIDEYFHYLYAGGISAAYALVFLAMATWLVQRNKHRLAYFTVLAANAALFIAITIPIVLSDSWITFSWAALAAALFWAAVRLEKGSLSVGAYIVLGVTIIRFFFIDYNEAFYFVDEDLAFTSFTGHIVARYLTNAAVLGAVGVFAYLSDGRDMLSRPVEKARSLRPWLTGLFLLCLFVIATVECSTFFSDYLPDARMAAMSILWAVLSVILIIAGFRTNNKPLRYTALGLFFFTLLKIFIVDMEEISTPYRILSFVIVGLLLLGASFVYHQFREDDRSA